MLLSRPATVPASAGEHVVWEGAFTNAELDRIEAYGDSLAKSKADLSGYRAQYDSIRVTQVAWIERNPDTAWLYHRVEEIVLRPQLGDL